MAEGGNSPVRNMFRLTASVAAYEENKLKGDFITKQNAVKMVKFISDRLETQNADYARGFQVACRLIADNIAEIPSTIAIDANKLEECMQAWIKETWLNADRWAFDGYSYYDLYKWARDNQLTERKLKEILYRLDDYSYELRKLLREEVFDYGK